MNTSRSVLTVTVVAGLFWLMSGKVLAHLEIQTYVYRDSYGSDQADPVNLLFTGNAFDTRVDAHITNMLGWSNTSGGDMYFDDHSGYQVQDYQRASGAFDRYHVRVEEADDYGGTWYGYFIGYYTAGAAHYEEVTYCGHVVVDFDGARDEVADPFDAQMHHDTDQYYVGNHDSSPQCDDSLPGSVDGYLRWVRGEDWNS